MDSARRSAFLTALGLDLSIAADCGPGIAEELIIGCDWWGRMDAPAPKKISLCPCGEEPAVNGGRGFECRGRTMGGEGE
ncbi:MAG TPA: hypothetical protein VMS11_03380 [Solirubrobacterales bacterium]|nr:hypothetical protein [Solirubrobacterales bacterium]